MLRDICDALTRRHGLTIVVEIYQGECTGNIERGVCRAIVAHWIGAHLNAFASGDQSFVNVFRQRALDLKKGLTAQSWLAHQHDFQFHRREFERLYQEHQKLLAEEHALSEELQAPGDDVLSRLTAPFKPTKEQLFARYKKVGAERQALSDRAISESKKTGRYMTMFIAQPYRTQDGITLSDILANFSALFCLPGFYIIGLPRHVVGLYTSGGSLGYVFIDPNTCEWLLPNLATAKAFLQDYFQRITDYQALLGQHCEIDRVVGAMLHEPRFPV